MRSVSLTTARFSLAFLLVFSLLTAQAQQNSPFTRYGLGEFYNSHHVVSRSMGGLSAAYADGLNNNVGQSINFNNPATYSGIYRVTFDLGFTIDSRTLVQDNPGGKFNSYNFIPSYMVVGIPLKIKNAITKGLGLSFGIKPLSSINYSVEKNERAAGDSLQTLYQGNGGLNQLFIGLGKKWNNLSIGFNTGYAFGRKDISTTKNFINDTVSYYQSNSGNVTTFGGMFLSGGLQYELLVKKKLTRANSTEHYWLRFGLTGALKHSLDASMDITKNTFTSTASGIFKIDSVFEQKSVAGKIDLPGTYAAGLTLHKTVTNSRGLFELWSIGLEYTATQWSKYRFYGLPDRVTDSWQGKLGIQFSPDPLSGRGYWSNVNYRFGVYIGKDYVDVDGNGFKTYGVSVGSGLPIKKWRNYDNAIVNYPPNNETGRKEMMQRVLTAIRQLHRLLNVNKDFGKPDELLNSYDVAHHAGLALEQEYELLGLLQEMQRLEYLKRHLNKVLPLMAGMETLKEKIQLNGHYKELKGFNFGS